MANLMPIRSIDLMPQFLKPLKKVLGHSLRLLRRYVIRCDTIMRCQPTIKHLFAHDNLPTLRYHPQRRVTAPQTHPLLLLAVLCY